MKCLIAEDDFISRRVLKEFMSPFGNCDIAVNGQEAIDSCRLAHESRRPYDVIFMDIMMPVVNGMDALLGIRALEKKMKIPPNMATKVVMITALDDPHTVITSFNKCEADTYIVKPLTRHKLVTELRALKLLE